jgi:hypothetical protein
MKYHQAILKINQAIIERLAHHKRNISTSTFPQASDYNKIRIIPNKYPATPINNNILKQYGLAIDSRNLLEKVDIKIINIRRVLNTISPETPQGQSRSLLAAPFTMPGMGNPQPIMQSIKQQGTQPTDTPRHHQQKKKNEDSSSLSELDNEDFREFKLTPRPAETATKKRKLNSDITAKDDKQKRDYNYSDNSPAT